MLPVSLQVLEAGDGGGGMSSLSVFSLVLELFEFEAVIKVLYHFSITLNGL